MLLFRRMNKLKSSGWNKRDSLTVFICTVIDLVSRLLAKRNCSLKWVRPILANSNVQVPSRKQQIVISSFQELANSYVYLIENRKYSNVYLLGTSKQLYLPSRNQQIVMCTLKKIENSNVYLLGTSKQLCVPYRKQQIVGNVHLLGNEKQNKVYLLGNSKFAICTFSEIANINVYFQGNRKQ